MPEKFYYQDIPVDQLIVNPNNARLIAADFQAQIRIEDEITAIKELYEMNNTHLLALMEDISKYGLNPHEMPIVMPIPGQEGYYVVAEGNRRITSIKLAQADEKTQTSLGISSGIIRRIKKSPITIDSVKCMVSSDQDFVDELIEKIHTNTLGVSRVEWDPQAQDKHRAKKQDVKRQFAVKQLLLHSAYTDEDTKEIFSETGWHSKLGRFLSNNTIATEYFGINFEKDNQLIQLICHEEEVVRALSKLLEDCYHMPATSIAQTSAVRMAYLHKFKRAGVLDKSNYNDPIIQYNVLSNTFAVTDLKSPYKVEPPIKSSSSESTPINADKKEEQNKWGSKPTNNSKPPTVPPKKAHKKGTTAGIERGPQQSTQQRSTVIPTGDNIAISDIRTYDLYCELQQVGLTQCLNMASVSIRSLIEFSVTIYLEEKATTYSLRGKDLIDKIKKVVEKLESTPGNGKKDLRTKIPKVYEIIAQHESKSEIYATNTLNILVHSHNYQAAPDDLKFMYNNFRPFLKLIWEELASD